MPKPTLPKHIQLLVLIFFIANLTHFVHNAEYIAFYPGIPAWLTREKIYLAWVAGASVGLAGLLVHRIRLKRLSMVMIAAYGASGVDGLAHYTLGLCSQHTLLANLTIWAEATTGLALLAVSALLLTRRLVAGRALASH